MCVLSRNSNKKNVLKKWSWYFRFFSFTFILRFVKKIFLLHLFFTKKSLASHFLNRLNASLYDVTVTRYHEDKTHITKTYWTKKKHENNVLHYKKLNNKIESRQWIVSKISKTLCHQYKGQETIALLHKFIR